MELAAVFDWAVPAVVPVPCECSVVQLVTGRRTREWLEGPNGLPVRIEKRRGEYRDRLAARESPFEIFPAPVVLTGGDLHDAAHELTRKSAVAAQMHDGAVVHVVEAIPLINELLAEQ